MRVDNIFKDFLQTVKATGVDLGEAQKNVLIRSANQTLTIVKKKTPVGVYKKNVSFSTKDGKEVHFKQNFRRIGGTLRRHWFMGKTHINGKMMSKEISNNIEYAVYVNNGHRKVNRHGETIGFVKGQFFLEAGTKKFDQIAKGFYKIEIERIKKKHGL